MGNLDSTKNWNTEIETQITDKWRKLEMYNFDQNTTKPVYSIDTPPPYINAPIHIGHAITYCFMDMFARYKRMKGFEVLFPLGLDNNGLPIEVGAEKRFKISALHTPRAEFLDYCKQLLEECGVQSIDSFAKLGISFSSYKEGMDIGSVYKTDAPEYRALTQKTFVDLFKKGIVYEDSRINNWDPKLQTTIADSEITRVDKETDLNYVKFKLVETEEDIIIATTRPELLCTSALIIYNPKDERYQHLANKKAITPLFGNEVSIIPHDDARPEFGSGIVFMSSSGGDADAVKFLRKVGIKPVSAVNIDGKMNGNAGFLEGMTTREGRTEVIKRLQDENLIEKQEKLMHSVPTSERSGAELEFVEMSEFYLKQMEHKEKVRELAEKDIAFYPEFSRNILNSWIDSVSIDWPISRRRFYATEIPLWHAEQDGKKLVALPTEMKYYQPWNESVPENAEVWSNGEKIGMISDFKDLEWIGETRVFDTWMDSSISELFMLRYSINDDFFNKSYPASLRPQGKEIVRTWLYYTLLRGYLETEKACFKDVWIHQHILDSKGFKMSKSKGNVIDPQDLMRDYGTEAIRIWAATEGDLSKGDISCSKERIQGEKKSLNKLLNVSKFVMMFDKPESTPNLTKLDSLFVNYVDGLTGEVASQYDVYDFNHPAQNLRRFLWDIFASHYIEMVKTRAYNEEKIFSDDESASARWTLHYLHERLLHLLFPIVPQITSFIAEDKGIDLLTASWPESKDSDFSKDSEVVEKIMEFNSHVWKTKKDKGVSLKEGIDGITIPDELSDFASDFRSCHKI